MLSSSDGNLPRFDASDKRPPDADMGLDHFGRLLRVILGHALTSVAQQRFLQPRKRPHAAGTAARCH
jgi:hypothetical protein